MKILIEIPNEAEATLRALAYLDKRKLKELNLEIYIAGLGALSKDNKRLAELINKE